MKPRLLDLFCGAGGASMGYYRAGFDVEGVDIAPQPRYPFKLHQGDALDYAATHGMEFDAIHASPPCQAYSVMTRGCWKDRLPGHIRLIADTREALMRLSKPYVIENVSGARAELIAPIMLCGSMFGLQTKEGNQLRRHRYFEISIGLILTQPCNHNHLSIIGVYGGGQNPSRRRRNPKSDTGQAFGKVARQEAMGIDWMLNAELNEAVPPAYTEFIGQHLLTYLKDNRNE